jgi:TolB protein
MRKAATIVGVGLAALALVGCSSSTPPAPAATTVPTPTGTTLGAPALGDGGRIAVSLKNDTVATIVSINPDGGDLQKLTDGKTFDACPDLGPAGKLIAFCRGSGNLYEIWLMDGTGGQQRQLTTLGGESTFPDISPDGQRVAFCGTKSKFDGDTRDIWVVGVDGQNLVQLTNTPTEDDCYPAWSPDGSKILFTSNHSGTPELWVMDATGQGAHALTTGESAGDAPPEWSPDGTKIAYIAKGGVWVMPAAGGSATQLTKGSGEDYAPAWSAKGNEIVYRHMYLNKGELRIVSVQSGQSRAVPIDLEGLPLAPTW